MNLKGLLPATLLLAALSASAEGQGKPVEFRQGDALSGPVKSARVERATYSRVGGELVEGPRRLVVVSNYTPDGRRKEYEGYAPDGSLRQRFVHVYDDAGREVEKFIYDGAGNLRTRVVQRPEAGETLTYDGDGSLRERRVVIPGADGAQAETRLYDGAGALKERSVNMREGGASVWSTYGPDGKLLKRQEHTPGPAGEHRTVYQTYAPDGSVVGRRVSEVDAAVSDLRATNDSFNPGPRKTRETREYDSRKNLIKQTTYALNEVTGEYEPTDVSYTTITYYR